MHLTKSSIARVCGLALGILLVGCSSSGGGSGDQTAPFIGTWTYTSGSIVPMCSLGSSPLTISNFDLTGDTMTVTKLSNTEVGTMLMGTGVMCDVKFTVSGTTATAEAGQSCVVTVPLNLGTGTMNIAVTIDISTWTLMVSGDTLTIAMTGSATAESGLVTCAPTASGTATRPASGG